MSKLRDDKALILAAAIIYQAVEDYRLLKETNSEDGGDRHYGRYSIKEIEEFFQSDFCSDILWCGLKSKLTGMEFLRAAT